MAAKPQMRGDVLYCMPDFGQILAMVAFWNRMKQMIKAKRENEMAVPRRPNNQSVNYLAQKALQIAAGDEEGEAA